MRFGFTLEILDFLTSKTTKIIGNCWAPTYADAARGLEMEYEDYHSAIQEISLVKLSSPILETERTEV